MSDRAGARGVNARIPTDQSRKQPAVRIAREEALRDPRPLGHAHPRDGFRVEELERWFSHVREFIRYRCGLSPATSGLLGDMGIPPVWVRPPAQADGE